MMDVEKLFSLPLYGLTQGEKEELFVLMLNELTEHHRERCALYRQITDKIPAEYPLPVRLFKEYDLLSVPEEAVIKTMTSSGTTGQAVSKIYLDRETSLRQSKALSKIVSDFIGKTRLPMLVVDSNAVLKNRNMFSARGAGILGFSMLGRGMTYALDEKMELDLPVLNQFYEKYQGQRVLLFGFTLMIWQYFVKALESAGVKLDLDGVLIHGGGWKKLKDEAVDNDLFKARIEEVTGIKEVYNYYGMVEQTGSIFMECPAGHLHASVFSDVIIRDPLDMSVKSGGKGLIQCNSLLPVSYPGHRLLTEDEGEILGIDDCPGRRGKYFNVYGRIKGAEIRGCSDTYERR